MNRQPITYGCIYLSSSPRGCSWDCAIPTLRSTKFDLQNKSAFGWNDVIHHQSLGRELSVMERDKNYQELFVNGSIFGVSPLSSSDDIPE